MKKDDFVGLVLLLIILDILLFGYALSDWFLEPNQFVILADGSKRPVTFQDALFVFKGMALTFDAFVSACFVGIPLIANRVTIGRWRG
jgi:hypothetical protein